MRTRGSASLQHKIRLITKNNKCGDVYGITIPRHIANIFSGCYFSIELNGPNIILHSGCDIKKEHHQKSFDKFIVSEKREIVL